MEKEEKKDFDWFKRNINLVDFLIDYGYTLHPDKNSRYGNNRFTSLEYHDSNTSDHLLVSRYSDTGIWVYMSADALSIRSDHKLLTRQNTEDKGSIIDFLASRENLSVRQIFKRLNDYSDGVLPNQVNNPISRERFAIKHYDDIKKYYGIAMLNPEKEFVSDFFKGRCIDIALTKTNCLDGRIFQREVVNSDTGNVEKNVCFPLYSKEGITGFYRTNKQKEGTFFKGILGSKDGSLWTTNAGEEVKKIFWSENPEEALSYMMLYPGSLSDKNVFCATIGTPMSSQIEALNQSLQTPRFKNIEEIILINDNDIAGAKFNIKFLSEINHKGQNTNIETLDVAYSGIRKENAVSVDITCKDDKNLDQETNRFVENIQKAIVSGDGNTTHKKTFDISLQQYENKDGKKTTSVNISFDSKVLNWQILAKSICDLKFDPENSPVKIQYSLFKDFNDDCVFLNGELKKDKSIQPEGMTERISERQHIGVHQAVFEKYSSQQVGKDFEKDSMINIV